MRRIVISSVIIFGLIGISLYGQYYLNDWRGRFWEDVSKRETHQMTSLLIQFTIAAFVLVYSSACQTWLQSKFSLLLRESLSNKLTIKYLKVDNVRRLGLQSINPDQRIAEDCRILTINLLNLISGCILNLAKAVIFIYLLYSFSVQFFNNGATLPLGTVVYASVSVLIVFGIGQLLRLVDKVSVVQSAEATYRTGLIQLEDNQHSTRFSIMAVQYKILFMRQKILNIFIGSYNQASVIIPLLFILPFYMINTAFSFGTLMQILNCVGEVILSLSFLTDNWSVVLETRTCAKRLNKLTKSLDK